MLFGATTSTQFNYTGDICISGSIDRTCKIWDVASGQCVQTLRGHSDEILDVCFNSTGNKLVTASADGTSRVYNTLTGACQAILIGHEGEISKVCFNPQGSKILTASSDHMARLWEVDTGDCLQVLEGHSDEIFSCAFNYEGDVSCLSQDEAEDVLPRSPFFSSLLDSFSLHDTNYADHHHWVQGQHVQDLEVLV